MKKLEKDGRVKETDSEGLVKALVDLGWAVVEEKKAAPKKATKKKAK